MLAFSAARRRHRHAPPGPHTSAHQVPSRRSDWARGWAGSDPPPSGSADAPREKGFFLAAGPCGPQAEGPSPPGGPWRPALHHPSASSAVTPPMGAARAGAPPRPPAQGDIHPDGGPSPRRRTGTPSRVPASAPRTPPLRPRVARAAPETGPPRDAVAGTPARGRGDVPARRQDRRPGREGAIRGGRRRGARGAAAWARGIR
eukprot:scaffold209_cov396-Prasinococcus_capsulatus_cf.AAC.8